MAIIWTRGLTKYYDGLCALDDLTLEIEEGEVFGLVGPNGAGKTTTLMILTTLLSPTRGNAWVCGFDVREQAGSIRNQLGMVFQEPSLDMQLTCWDNLDFHGRLYHMPKDIRRRRIEEVLELVGLGDWADETPTTLSGGMRRRLELARALLHRPAVLFLDEPTLALDPQARQAIWEHIRTLSETKGTSVVVATNYMEEAEFLCDRVAIIHLGRLMALGSPEELKNAIEGDVIQLESSDPHRMLESLRNFPLDGMQSVALLDDRLTIEIKQGEKLVPALVELARSLEIPVQSVSLKRPSLQDVFIHYTRGLERVEEE
ncbi:MAG: ATP-binding cassette domain-containing protein [Dehalococcoidia bacterium]